MVDREISVFIKTCKKDLAWLRLAIQSIRKYLHIPYEIVVVADEDCKNQKIPEVDKTIYVPTPQRGYLYQNLVKVCAHTYGVSTPIIMFTDSDTLLTKPVHKDDVFADNKPIFVCSKYSDLVGKKDYQFVKEYATSVQNLLGIKPTREYMRRMPIVAKTDTLRQLHPHIKDHVEKLTTIAYTPPPEGYNFFMGTLIGEERFSEFNTIGTYADKYNHNEYVWMPPKKAPVYSRQFWSWGETIEEHQDFIDKIL